MLSSQNTAMEVIAEKVTGSFLSWVSLIGNRRQGKSNSKPQKARTESQHPTCSSRHFTQSSVFLKCWGMVKTFYKVHCQLKHFSLVCEILSFPQSIFSVSEKVNPSMQGFCRLVLCQQMGKVLPVNSS